MHQWRVITLTGEKFDVNADDVSFDMDTIVFLDSNGPAFIIPIDQVWLAYRKDATPK